MEYKPIDLKQEMKEIVCSSLKISLPTFLLIIAIVNTLNTNSKTWLFFHIFTVMWFTTILVRRKRN